jgi:branched-subunit amino acid ABC-type transport system permease component
MTHEEKRAWIRLVVAVLGYTVYVAIMVSRVDGRPLPDVPYVSTLLWTVGAAIVASIVAEIGMAIVLPGASRAKDARDREIGHLGDHVGQSFVVIGAVAAMLMAMADWNRFWIANVIYLCFVLSAILGGIAKVIVYRRSLPEW